MEKVLLLGCRWTMNVFACVIICRVSPGSVISRITGTVLRKDFWSNIILQPESTINFVIIPTIYCIYILYVYYKMYGGVAVDNSRRNPTKRVRAPKRVAPARFGPQLPAGFKKPCPVGKVFQFDASTGKFVCITDANAAVIPKPSTHYSRGYFCTKPNMNGLQIPFPNPKKPIRDPTLCVKRGGVFWDEPCRDGFYATTLNKQAVCRDNSVKLNWGLGGTYATIAKYAKQLGVPLTINGKRRPIDHVKMDIIDARKLRAAKERAAKQRAAANVVVKKAVIQRAPRKSGVRKMDAYTMPELKAIARANGVPQSVKGVVKTKKQLWASLVRRGIV